MLSSCQAGSILGFDAAWAVAADADGNFILAGVTTDSLDGEAVNAGGNDLAVIKISSVDGSVVWSWQVGASVLFCADPLRQMPVRAR